MKGVEQTVLGLGICVFRTTIAVFAIPKLDNAALNQAGRHCNDWFVHGVAACSCTFFPGPGSSGWLGACRCSSVHRPLELPGISTKSQKTRQRLSGNGQHTSRQTAFSSASSAHCLRHTLPGRGHCRGGCAYRSLSATASDDAGLGQLADIRQPDLGSQTVCHELLIRSPPERV